MKKFLRNLLNQSGFELYRIPINPKWLRVLHYELVKPSATYAPWTKDALFQAVHAQIRTFTKVDRYRCFDLWKLVEQSAKLPGGALIQIGTWRGGTGALIARQALNVGIKDKVYLCDTFEGVVKAGPKDSTYKGGEHSDTTKALVEDLVFKQMKLNNVEILKGIFPDQTAHHVENLKFRFCHIDVDVYESAKGTMEWVWDRMVPGGIVVFDDYGFPGCDGIVKYVEEQMQAPDRIVLHNLNGHAVVLKFPR